MWLTYAIVAALGVGTGCIVWSMILRVRRASDPSPTRETTLIRRTLLGLGIVLFGAALLAVAAIGTAFGSGKL